MNHLKGMHGVRLRPDSALVELRGRLFNRTAITQSFLWWANIAVKVHNDYESFFPSDVHYIADHAVRAMSEFPFANNHYYGIPYHERAGKNDLRKYQNIPVPTSYMVCDTKYSFFGGYDHKAEGGFVHVANKHIAPGKKQWTWGNEAFGKAWDRELSDSGDPYFELMAGVYTDNQPDFSYLLPYETKTFSQFWWGYKKIGTVQNADKNLAIRLEILEGNKLDLAVASSRMFENLKIVVTIGESREVWEHLVISPSEPWQDRSMSITSGQENQISLAVYDANNTLMLSYSRIQESKTRSRKVAQEPKSPEKISSTYELELIAEHLELYRHPTRYAEPYLKEAIARDPNNHKAYTLLGRIALRRGQFEKAETALTKAIEITTTFHPNPASGEAHYYAGMASRYQNKMEEAYTLFYKAIWNFEWRAAGYYQLATLDVIKQDYITALEHLEAALDTNRQNNKALVLKVSVLRRLDRLSESKEVLSQLLKTDPLDQWGNFESGKLNNDFSQFLSSSRNDAQTILDCTLDYTEAGLYDEALELLQLHHDHEPTATAVPNPMQKSPMTHFLCAWIWSQMNQPEKAQSILVKAEGLSPDYCFPSRLQEQIVLGWALKKGKNLLLASFGLGNYLFDLKRQEEAIEVWERAIDQNCTYGTLYRNLGIAYWNVRRDHAKALDAYIKAIELSPDDVRIRYEYDQLCKKLNHKPSSRLANIRELGERILDRDDFCIEYAALLNFEGKHEQVLNLLNSRNFHPWEGGEGQVLKQYSQACIELGQSALDAGNPKEALKYFDLATDTPDNLGEKYHPLQAKAQINYLKGRAYRITGNEEKAEIHFSLSANEQGDFIDMAVSQFSEMTYYRALSMKALAREQEAKALMTDLKNYGMEQIKAKSKIDYFATSLPDILVFDEDADLKSQNEGTYLLALAELGLGNENEAASHLQKVLEVNKAHYGAKSVLTQLKHSIAIPL